MMRISSILATACLCATTACADNGRGGSPSEAASTGTPGAEKEEYDVVIRETTEGKLGGVGVGVGNMWEREYELADGRTRTGLTARLYLGQGKTLVVGRGSVVEIGDGRFEVGEVEKPSDGHGKVRFRPAE